MLTGQDIVFISSIEWDFLWQGPQEIATRLARAGNRVLYVENTGVRAPGLRDASRVVRRLKLWTKSLSSNGVREVAPNLYVCSPLVLPPFGPGWRRRANRHLLLPMIKRAVSDLGMRDVLLWTFLPTDTALEIIRQLRTPQSVVVYYYVDNFSQVTPYTRQLEASKKALLRISDLTFATCRELADHCADAQRDVHIFPYGVNLDAFPLDDHARDNGDDPHAAAREGERAASSPAAPVIGYVGGLHRHVDFDLLTHMARARPQWSWIYVGSLQTTAGSLLAELPNVRLLGAQPHGELADHIRRFDVCIVPYVDSPYTRTVVPTKINEYLAVGKPVVSTALPAVSDFNRHHGVLLTTDTRPENFLRAIEQALRMPKDGATRARRREVATLGDWQTRLEEMSALIEAAVQRKKRAGKAKG